MAVENAADRAAFVSSDDFGLAATYTPAGGAAASVTVILDEPHEDAALARLGAIQVGYTCRIRADDVAAPAAGDAIAIEQGSPAMQFTVRNARQDLSGKFWTLDLEKDS